MILTRPAIQFVRLAVLTGTLVAAGCATSGAIQAFRYVAPEGRGAFAPVRVLINRNLQVPEFYYSRHQVIQTELTHSGAFAAVGPDIQSPYLLDMRLGRQSSDSTGTSAGQLVSAATLFLIPSKVRNVNRLEVDFYVEGRHVRRYEYTGAYEETLSLYNYSQLREGGDEFLSIRNMVNHLLRDLDQDNMLPRIGSDPGADNDADPLSI